MLLNLTDKVEIDNEFLSLLCKSSFGAQGLFLKIMNHYLENTKFPTCKELFTISNMSKSTYYLYFNELLRYGFIDTERKESNKFSIFIIKDMELKQETLTYKNKEVVKKKISKKQVLSKLIREQILYPYYDEIKKRGRTEIFTGNFRKFAYAKINHVRKQYEDILKPKDVLNILLIALEDPYLNSINQFMNIDLIFFNNPFLVSKYVKEKPNMVDNYCVPNQSYFVQDIDMNVLNPSDYGHYKKSYHGYIHVPPIGLESFYMKVKEEMNNRMYKGKINEEYDKYFDGLLLKKEYGYLIGSSGEGNKFVKKDGVKE